MNVKIKNITAFFKIGIALMFLSSCNLAQVIKKAENQKISLQPQLLERFGDAVSFNLKVVLPNQTLTKGTVYSLLIEFRYGGTTYQFNNDLKVKGDTLDPYTPVEMEETFKMPFREGMENGTLVAYGEISQGKRRKGNTSTVVLTRGIATTASLSQIGQYYLDENIPFLGLEVAYGDPEAYGMFAEGWNGFQRLLMSYSNLSFMEKAKFMEVINGPGDVLFKMYKFQELPNFSLVNRDILPKFKAYRENLNTDGAGIADLELSILSRQIRIGEKPATTIPEPAYARAIAMESGWEEKEALLLALAKAHPSSYAYNNLGVVYLNQANRTIEPDEKNTLLQNAANAFDQSNAYFQNPYANYNLGLVYWMLQDKISAYRTFYKAMVISRSDKLKKIHEAALGAVSNFNGDYRLAAIHLNHAEKNTINLFNQGLANLLARDYYNAMIKFEESAMQDRNNGYPFYGIALIAARNGEEMILYENLNKAINRSDFLRKRAPLDREFFDYHEREGFKEAIRP
jgi:hypothetical protein